MKDDDEILIYAIKVHGSTIWTTDPKTALGIIEYDLELTEDNVGIKCTVEVKRITQKKYESLPEFEGY
jgi:hypothetical protein